MKSIILLAVLAVVSGRHLKIDELEYGYCDGAHEPLTFDDISIAPFPIVVADGANITLHILVTLLEDVPVGAKVKLEIVKEGLINLPIPCILVDGLHIGSW